MITRPEADYLAALIRIHRPHWDHLVIMDNLILVGEHRDLADVAHAAIRTAQDPAMLTPQALKFVDSPHWRPTVRGGPDYGLDAAEETIRRSIRAQEVARCGHCDGNGRLPNGYLCAHEDPEERARRAHDRAQAALAQVRVTRTNALNEETQP